MFYFLLKYHNSKELLTNKILIEALYDERKSSED